MPVTSIVDELAKARAGGYAVALFDTADSVSTEGMLSAIREKEAPTIVALYDTVMQRPSAPGMAAYIRARLAELTVPVSFMLDHGNGYDQCMKAMALGCTDVMFDGSRLPMDENMEITARVVREAHARGVGVEAELGHVGSGSGYSSFGGRREGFTDPDSVELFVRETGVDILAVAIGTAHGLYDGEPSLDLELLAEIRRRTDIPLVLHGGSGLSAGQFRGAIDAGISKINVATDLFVSAGRCVAEAAVSGTRGYGDLIRAAETSFSERCGYYLDLFGSTGKGRRR